MAELQQVFYVSRSLASPTEVEELLERSRTLNAVHQLSGALLYTGGHFSQLLEGPPENLQATMGRIVTDPRHTGVRRLKEEPISRRRFGQWTMASTEVDGADDLLAHLLAVREISVQRVARLIDLMFEKAWQGI